MDALAATALGEQEDLHVRTEALLKLIRADDPRGETWPSLARHPRLSSADAIKILQALVQYKHRNTTDEVLSLLSDCKIMAGIRVRAGSVLAVWGDRRAVPGIVDMLMAPVVDSSTLREELLDDLGQLADPKTEGLLVGVMEDSSLPGGERVAAAGALLRLGNTKAEDFIFRVYPEVGGEVERYPFGRLTQLIGRIGGERAVKALSQQTDGPCHRTIEVVGAMRTIGSHEFVAPLLRIAGRDGEEAHVRIAAAEALLEALDKLSPVQQREVAAMVRGVIAEVPALYPQYVTRVGELATAASAKGISSK